ncbi:uncharacterized protein A4U43_C04F13280 [Asparagus officinalis]|uniref:Uncharacterized protein n=1 Tax=Asparagus officinalis TaxID=4686 RepID=A0A5P1F0J6_ASPOF|nr:uncharacterized protein A4U43_C04F13280 [Asparagus officinalis]
MMCRRSPKRISQFLYGAAAARILRPQHYCTAPAGTVPFLRAAQSDSCFVRQSSKIEEKIESATDILKEILNPVVAEAEEVSWPPRDPEALILMEKVASCEVMFYECLPDV